jgi:hypothetical protein
VSLGGELNRRQGTAARFCMAICAAFLVSRDRGGCCVVSIIQTVHLHSMRGSIPV